MEPQRRVAWAGTAKPYFRPHLNFWTPLADGSILEKVKQVVTSFESQLATSLSPEHHISWSSRSASPDLGVETHPSTTLSSLTPVIGTYDPIPKPDPYSTSGELHKDIKLDLARARYWVGVGAQPTDTAWRLLSMVGILPKKDFGPKGDQTKPKLDVDKIKIR
ncbi:ribosomal protein S16 [Paramyrothecium foliicola]|nr:ribosomal protein S16 [Paramyrothecium foliicola]